MKWFVKCIRNYVNFKGRARRSEYWYFILFSLIFSIAAKLLDTLIDSEVGLFSMLLALFLILPQLAVMVRRLHDTDRSGKIVLWYYVVSFVWVIAMVVTGFSSLMSFLSGDVGALPVGFLVLLFGGLLVFLVWGICFLVWFCTPGTKGENKYGPDPMLEQ